MKSNGIGTFMQMIWDVTAKQMISNLAQLKLIMRYLGTGKIEYYLLMTSVVIMIISENLYSSRLLMILEVSLFIIDFIYFFPFIMMIWLVIIKKFLIFLKVPLNVLYSLYIEIYDMTAYELSICILVDFISNLRLFLRRPIELFLCWIVNLVYVT